MLKAVILTMGAALRALALNFTITEVVWLARIKTGIILVLISCAQPVFAALEDSIFIIIPFTAWPALRLNIIIKVPV